MKQQARCRQDAGNPCCTVEPTLSPLPAAAVYIETTNQQTTNGSHNCCITIVPPVTQIFLYAEERAATRKREEDLPASRRLTNYKSFLKGMRPSLCPKRTLACSQPAASPCWTTDFDFDARHSPCSTLSCSPLPAAAVYIETTRPRANNGSHNGCITIVPPVTH